MISLKEIKDLRKYARLSGRDETRIGLEKLIL